MKLLLPHFPILIKTYVEFWIHVIQMDPVPAGNLVTAELGWGGGRGDNRFKVGDRTPIFHCP